VTRKKCSRCRNAPCWGDLGNLFVFVRDGNSFERRNVVIGMKAGDQVEIVEGLLPGDLVVTEGHYQLQFRDHGGQEGSAGGLNTVTAMTKAQRAC
jgi:hypothetical protein